MAPSGSGFWRITLKDFLQVTASIILAIAALKASCETEDVVDWLKSRKVDSYPSGASWRASDKYHPSWRDPSFDDTQWKPATSPWREMPAVELSDGPLPTMWGDASDAAREIFFRRVLYLPDRDRVERVTLRTIADDDAAVWINGFKVVSDGDTTAGPLITTDVTAATRAGPNLVAIRATNYRGGRYLAVDLRVQRK